MKLCCCSLTILALGARKWMEALSAAMWARNGEKSWTDLYQPLTKMLYEIGFIGIARPPKGKMIYFYDDATLADNPVILEHARNFNIHPAYHMALDLKANYRRARVAFD